MTKIAIDPLTRIEGHLKVEAIVENGVVKEARTSGTLFRGFEIILKERDPQDAPIITQRICGVCPTAHATASALALDDAFGIADKIPHNGRVIRNLILGANFLQSHILHFYHLAALDYVDVTKVADYDGKDTNLLAVKEFIERGELGPFFPRYEGDYRLTDEENRAAVLHYLQALEMRRRAHEILCTFGGKMPHQGSIVAGGVTEVPTVDKITSFLWRLNQIRDFINGVYLPDILMVAKRYPDHLEIGKGCGNYLTYGVFDLESDENIPKRKRLIPPGRTGTDLKLQELNPEKIKEDVKNSWYADSSSGKHPSQGETLPQPEKKAGYSWLKSPRYDGQVHEVGPLARLSVFHSTGDKTICQVVDSALSELGVEKEALFSTLGRHAARALECKLVADRMAHWIQELKPGEPVACEYEVPDEGQGMGLTGAPRGALGHWIEIKGKKISRYQCVVPTTWNASPRDDKGQPGPIEQALEGTKIKDEENPFEIVRIVRSFDPCLACAVHILSPKGKVLTKVKVI